MKKRKKVSEEEEDLVKEEDLMKEEDEFLLDGDE